METSVWAGLALVLVSIQASTTHASTQVITESEAIRLFLEESPQARSLPLRAQEAAAESSLDAQVANPIVAYQIEDAAGVRDEFLIFEQELPITGRRDLLRQRSEAASAAEALIARRDLQNSAYALKLAFYDVLYRETAVGSLRGGNEALGSIVAMLRDRERHGEGSGYDLLRAEQELAEGEIDLARAQAASSASRARFASFFDRARRMESAPIEGDFAPAGPAPDAAEAVAQALSRRTDLLALSEEARRQDLEVDAARRQRYPEPTLSAGWKRVEALGESDSGFVASLMVPIPIFSRGSFAAARAEAASGQVELRREILEREIRAEVEAALAQDQAARQAAERLGGEGERRGDELRRIAQLAYDEGERGILELLDAHRTGVRMELQALEARHEAKRARIELDRVLGEEVQP